MRRLHVVEWDAGAVERKFHHTIAKLVRLDTKTQEPDWSESFFAWMHNVQGQSFGTVVSIDGSKYKEHPVILENDPAMIGRTFQSSLDKAREQGFGEYKWFRVVYNRWEPGAYATKDGALVELVHKIVRGFKTGLSAGQWQILRYTSSGVEPISNNTFSVYTQTMSGEPAKPGKYANNTTLLPSGLVIFGDALYYRGQACGVVYPKKIVTKNPLLKAILEKDVKGLPWQVTC
jgi:hypothetical protein